MAEQKQQNKTFLEQDNRSFADDKNQTLEKIRGKLFTATFGSEEGQLLVEAGRYRLIWAEVCPFAQRSKIVMALLGLDDVISTGTVHPVKTQKGWEFSLDEGGVDPVLGIRYLDELYYGTDPDFPGRTTVPALVDVKTKRVVSNDYFRLTNDLETAWKPFHKPGAPDLYPEELRTEIDALNDLIYREINHGVYDVGLATTQEEYEKEYDKVFARLDWLEERLSHQRYLFGGRITDADVRLYTTLARFDAVYNPLFRANRNLLAEFPNLWNYAKDLYQTPGFGSTTHFDAIKRGYVAGFSKAPYSIIQNGPDPALWQEPHDRGRFA